MGASILGSLFVLGGGIVAGASGSGQWRQDMNALAVLAVWQAVAVVLTLAASAMFGGRVREVLALHAPPRRPAST